MVMRLLLGGLAVPLEEVGESHIILIMHGGGAAAFAAARYLVAVVYVVLSAKHCQQLRCCGGCYHNTDPADGVTQTLCQHQVKLIAGRHDFKSMQFFLNHTFSQLEVPKCCRT